MIDGSIKDIKPDAPLSFGSSRFEHEIYSNVALKARLLDIRLVKSTYDVRIELFDAADDSFSHFRNEFTSDCSDIVIEQGSGRVGGLYTWTAEIKSGRTKALKLFGRYFTIYGNLDGCNEEYMGLYFRKIARFATYPYFRALFSMQTGNSGLLLPPLPSLTERLD